MTTQRKLEQDDARAIRWLYAELRGERNPRKIGGISMNFLAEIYGVPRGTIADIIRARDYIDDPDDGLTKRTKNTSVFWDLSGKELEDALTAEGYEWARDNPVEADYLKTKLSAEYKEWYQESRQIVRVPPRDRKGHFLNVECRHGQAVRKA